MTERMVKSQDIELWTESFGDPGHPPLLLVMGASAQGILWPEELIELLVAGGHYVIRYDHRDTGQSSCIDFQKHPYTLAELAQDALGVLDAYGLHAAHLMGASMGGMICQLLGILHPERVLSLTLVMSTPLRTGVVETFARAFQGLPATEALPPPAPRAVEAFRAAASNPPRNPREAVDLQVKMARALSGSAAPFDEQACRRDVERMFNRARNPAASANHGLVPSPTPEQAEALKQLRVPTLVIHGMEDPMFPPAHGVAAAERISGARLLLLEGMGHDLPRPLYGEIARAVLTHTAR